MTYDEIKIFTDGGSRGNPGPAASGVVILTMQDELIEGFGRYLGDTTNNQAEWQAVVFALEEAKKYNPKIIHFFMDSQLVCRQLTGHYKVKNIDLRPHFLKAIELAQHYDVRFEHVYRENNTLADAEVNKCIDAVTGRKKRGY
jgi:ribonuclease HI